MITKNTYSKFINICSAWDIVDSKFKKEHKNCYRWKKAFHCMSTKVGDKVTKTVYSNSNKRLIHEEEVFDIIFSHHEQFGHRKSREMHNALKDKYHNTSEECLILFVETCPI